MIRDCELTEVEVKGAVQCLWEVFGGTITSNGFRTLDSHVGLIYGDSITMDRCHKILSRLADNGFSSDNVVFGIGSYTYQYSTRDTLGFAVKSTYGQINGEAVELFKDPVTDSGIKKSAKGMIRVSFDESTKTFTMVDQITFDSFLSDPGAMKLRYQDGEFFNSDVQFNDIRNRIKDFNHD